MSTALPSQVIIVLTTLSASTDATALARTLIEEQLAACVNILPSMTSVYRWQGAVEQEQEQQLMVKTSRHALDALQTRLHELHPYTLPEFVVLTASGSDAYAQWVHDNVTSGRGA